MKSALRFPHPLVLLVGFILLATLLSYVLPAGTFARRPDAATGRAVVVAGSYHRVPAAPVSPLAALVAIPRGLADAAGVIFFVFLTGGPSRSWTRPAPCATASIGWCGASGGARRWCYP